MAYKSLEDAKKHHKEWWAKHKHERNARRRAAYKLDPEKIKRRNNSVSYKRYGWTPELYDAKYKEQRGGCAVCGKPPDTKALAADHKHSNPPKPRGLLCDLCNRGLGLFLDSPALLRKAAEYIEHYDM